MWMLRRLISSVTPAGSASRCPPSGSASQEGELKSSHMSYAVAIERLAALGQELYNQPGKPRHKFELEHMRALMAALGNPQRQFASVLIAGTNGKGSTASTLASILREAGYRTGLYTSPHLSRVNERIQVDGLPISDNDFADLFRRVDEAAQDLIHRGELPGVPSFFETVTAIGFLNFASRGVHTAVLEVGMGGRLDATNIVEPAVSIIADISFDHMEWLGNTIHEIAGEKAGILRPKGVMVTLPQGPEATKVLNATAARLGARAVAAEAYLPPSMNLPDGSALPGRNRYALTVMGERIQVDSPLRGPHQKRNLALAIAATVELRNNHGYDITLADIENGIRNTVWPARLETIPAAGGRPAILLDAGHNPAGVKVLRASLAAVAAVQPRNAMTLVFGCLRDKPVAELTETLCPLFGQVIVTEIASPRTTALSDLVHAARNTGADVTAANGSADALDRAIRMTPPDGLIVVAGSVYLVGEVRKRIAPPPFALAETLVS